MMGGWCVETPYFDLLYLERGTIWIESAIGPNTNLQGRKAGPKCRRQRCFVTPSTGVALLTLKLTDIYAAMANAPLRRHDLLFLVVSQRKDKHPSLPKFG